MPFTCSINPPPTRYRRALAALAKPISELIRIKERETGLRHVALIQPRSPKLAATHRAHIRKRHPDLAGLALLDSYPSWSVVVVPTSAVVFGLLSLSFDGYNLEAHCRALDRATRGSEAACLLTLEGSSDNVSGEVYSFDADDFLSERAR